MSKLNEAKKEAYLEELRGGLGRGMAADAIEINRGTIRQHIQADEKFAADVSQAEIEANEIVEEALFQAAQSGNVVACQIWLYNRAPDRWRQRQDDDGNFRALRKALEKG